MDKTSIIIPARNEPWLEKTIDDIYQHAVGEFEVIAVLDGYWPNPPLTERANLTLIHTGESRGMRAGINMAVALAKGKYILKADAHCSFAEGFDEVLQANCEEDWVVIPRRYSLDVETWRPRDRPPVDYEYFLWPKKFDPIALHGFHWDERTAELMGGPMIDDTLTFQGSCYFMHKKHYVKCGLSISGYHGLPQQEAEEIGLQTWYTGGRVIVNKKTSYAHFHKNERFYFIDRGQSQACYTYSYNRMVVEQRDKFVALINKFWPLPHWPPDWENRLYGKS